MFHFFRHLCDGVWQCTAGDDENTTTCEGEVKRCAGFFRCVIHTKSCLHLIEVCNHVQDCYSGEDESFCELLHQCPSLCRCLMYATTCKNTSQFEVIPVQKLIELTVFLHLYKISRVTQNLFLNDRITIFVWQNSNLSDICNVLNFSSTTLYVIDFSSNLIRSLTDFCFHSLNLKFALFSNNTINHVQKNAFAGIRKLVKLDISSNSLYKLFIPSNTARAQLLNFSGNMFVEFDATSFQDIQINLLSADDWRVCCLLGGQGTHCSSQPPWPHNCDKLLSPLSAQIIFYLGCFVVVVLNIFSSAVGFWDYLKVPESQMVSGVKVVKKEKTSKAFQINTLFLHFNDVLCGFSMLFLSLADLVYSWSFFWDFKTWSQSMPCKMIGFLTTFVTQDYFFLLHLLSVSAMVVVKCPLKAFVKEPKVILQCVVVGKVFCVCTSCVALITHHTTEEDTELPYKTCHFIGQTSKSITIFVMTVYVVVVHVGSLIAEAILDHSMVTELKRKPQLSLQNDKPHKKVFRKLVVQWVCHTMCWLSSAVIHIISLTVPYYPADILLWNITVIVPFICINNSYSYCISPKVRGCFKQKHVSMEIGDPGLDAEAKVKGSCEDPVQKSEGSK